MSGNNDADNKLLNEQEINSAQQNNGILRQAAKNNTNKRIENLEEQQKAQNNKRKTNNNVDTTSKMNISNNSIISESNNKIIGGSNMNISTTNNRNNLVFNKHNQNNIVGTKFNTINYNQNYAKNGINNEEKIPNGNSEGANKSRLRDLFNKKKGIKDFINPQGTNKTKKSLFGNRKKFDQNLTAGEQTVYIVGEGIKKFIKKSLIPFFAFFIFLFIILIIVLSENGDKGDARGGDYNLSASDWEVDDLEQKEFYEKVSKLKEEYKNNSKEINTMYITATFHILNRHASVKYDDMTDELIKEMADGMLGNATVYNKETYSDYLKQNLFPRYFSESKIDNYIKEVFEYIDEYNKDVYGGKSTNKCETTTGGSCTYNLKDYRGNSINVSNLKVRLMSSSNCHGTDNVAISDELIPFEEYILGVARSENYDKEESTKVQLIAARNFALNRPSAMGPSLGNKYVTEGNTNILQMRSCVADQMFCSADKGCSADGPYFQKGKDCYVSYVGTGHSGIKWDPLSETAPIRKYWEDTIGVVALDENGRLPYLTYTKTDQDAWNAMAANGASYTQILLAHYKNVKEVKKVNCSTTTEKTENAFLKTAKEVWTEVTNRFIDYNGGGNQVPPTRLLIDCSTYVDWVLYKYGYEDFGGAQKPTEYFFTTNLNEKYGWTEIPVAAGENVTNKLQPGDILVRHHSNADGHMNIIVEIREDGSIWGYDCGGKNHWLSSKGGQLYRISDSFVKSDRRPGKIIRVSDKKLGDTCQTAASGEWTTWRQDNNSPWSNIPLGTRGDTIGTIGCYVTSIAIQIARSGANTTISNFNPGTFVNEIKKTPNAFSDIGELNWAGENSISNFVPGFKTVASHVPLGSTKEEQIATINKYIDQGYYVVLNVKGGGHWVPVIGTTKDNVQMRDPSTEYKNVYDAYPVSSCIYLTAFEIK